MDNKMQTLDLFTATAANANLFNEENKAQKAHTRSTLGSTIKMNVMQAMKTIERQFGKCFFEMVDELENKLNILKDKSTIPDKPDMKSIMKFKMHVNEMIVKGE
jgi:citrate lyase gamma subunit